MSEKGKKTFVMYDIRSLQRYIFKTNRVKEIIGASYLIDTIVKDSIEYAQKESGLTSQEVDDDANPGKQIERALMAEPKVRILSKGAGGAYLTFSSEDLAKRFSRIVAKYILENSYSLYMDIAMVPWSGKYFEDYKNLRKEMDRIKRETPVAGWAGALPIVKIDQLTGQPMTYTKLGEMSTEGALKVNASARVQDDTDNQKKLDELVTAYGKDSTIAIVHIDGNNLGKRIETLMNELGNDASYDIATGRMREISTNIETSFKETYKKMVEMLSEAVEKQGGKILKRGGVYIRKIILAGDDLTFVCNAKVAMGLVDYFCQEITKRVMFEPKDPLANRSDYQLSVCAGIAYVHSHFPFSVGYQVAEACCDNAKRRARELASEDGEMGNWMDFQICRSVHSQQLAKDREKDYVLSDGTILIKRPYFVEVDGKMGSKEEGESSFNGFKQLHRLFSSEPMANRAVHGLRLRHPQGRHEVESYERFLKARGKPLSDALSKSFIEVDEKVENGDKKEDEKEDKKVEKVTHIAQWYDALEMFELYEDISEWLEQESKNEAN